MAGRRRFDEEAVLEHAMLTFWERGFAATSIDDLTTSTGLGRGSLYGAFGSKDHLFGEALRRYGGRYGARYDAALQAHRGSPADAIGAFLDVTVRRILDPAVPGGCLIVESVMARPQLTAATAALSAALVDAQRRRVRAALGGAPSAEADQATELIVTVNQGLAVLGRAQASEAQLRAAAAQALRPIRELERARPR